MRRSTWGVAPPFALDLHVLGTPPAFVLSQDQTLKFDVLTHTYVVRFHAQRKRIGILNLILMRGRTLRTSSACAPPSTHLFHIFTKSKSNRPKAASSGGLPLGEAVYTPGVWACQTPSAKKAKWLGPSPDLSRPDFGKWLLNIRNSSPPPLIC